MYFMFGITPMEGKRNLSLITREDPETCKQIMYSIITRPNFQIKVDILVLGSLHTNFSVD